MWEDIKTAKLNYDDDLEHFTRRWKHFLANLLDGEGAMPPRTVLRTFLTPDRLRKSKVLEPDIREFDRMDDDDPNRCIQWLYKCIDRVVYRDRLEKARKTQEQRLRDGGEQIDDFAIAPCCSCPSRVTAKESQPQG